MNVCRMHGGILGGKKAKKARKKAAFKHGLYSLESLDRRKNIYVFIDNVKKRLMVK